MRTLWVVGLVATIGCTKPNPNRCCTDEADCVAKDIPTSSFCADGLVCRGNQCIAQPCTDSSQCDPAAPFCIDELCAEQCTDDAQCPGFAGEPAAPYCVAGGCVSCRDANDCTMTEPYCDAGTCRPCKAHSECDSQLCEFDTGQCIAELTITYAAPAGSATSNCTKSDPCTLDRALSTFDASRANLKLAEGTYPQPTVTWAYGLSLNVYGPAEIDGAFGHQPSSSMTRIRDLHTKSLYCGYKGSAEPRPTLDVDRLVVAGIVSVDECQFVMRHSQVSGTTTAGNGLVRGSGTFIDIDMIISDSEIDGGYWGILADGGTSLTLTNSIIKNQTNNAIRFAAGATSPLTRASSVSFTSFYNTVWACGDGNVVFSSHNNIFLNENAGAPANTVSGTLCRHDYDLIEPQSTTPPGANNLLAMDPRFVNAAGGDFHLTASSPAIDAADPASTEAADHDGIPRPQGAGRDIGAFEYKP